MKIRSVIPVFLCFSAATAHAQENKLNETGNVGIGTLTPTEKLDVKGNVRIDSTLTVSQSFIANGTVLFPSLTDSSSLNQVLILGLNGQVRGNKINDLVYSDQIPSQLPCLYDTNGQLIQWNPQWLSKPGVLHTSSRCNPNVRVGIGTGNPLARLHINLDETNYATPAFMVTQSTGHKLLQVNSNGLVLARELKLDVAAWPDYVFDEQYPLLPLDQLGDYIQENKHLPNVPSACEMEENGVNVSETSVLLIEKVEELTLYLVELQQQLKIQQALIGQQQQEINKMKTSNTAQQKSSL